MKKRTPQNQVKLWKDPALESVEVMQAHYRQQTFPRHTHDGFGLGVIEHGALGFYYRGSNLVAPAGSINIVNPDEVHTGQAATEQGWSYRMFYFNAALLQNIASQISDQPEAIPFFQAGVLHDPLLAQSLFRFHLSIENKENSRLEKESYFLELLSHFVQKHACFSSPLYQIGQEPRAILQTRDFLESHYDDDVSIETLAELARLSPFHFIRVFKETLGLTPHAYLTQVRVRRAKTLIQQGSQLVDTALSVGFTDQSHLHRHFKRAFGYTPGQYRNFILSP